MTKAELVKQTGLAKQTVLNLKKEYRQPNLGTILRVSKVFGVTLDWLVTGKGPKFRKC